MRHHQASSVVRVTSLKMITSLWNHLRRFVTKYLLLDATLCQHVQIFHAATHLPPQATTRSRLPMAQLFRPTVTRKEPTVEEKEAG